MALAQEANGNTIWSGGWRDASDARMSQGKSRYTSKQRAAAAYQFHGTDVALVATTAPNRGRARVWMDGKQVGIVDEYSPTTLFRQRVFSIHVPEGDHKLTIQVLGTQNSKSKGARFDVDAFQALVPGGLAASYAQPCSSPWQPTGGLIARSGL
jgi:hypothetical protein